MKISLGDNPPVETDNPMEHVLAMFDEEDQRGIAPRKFLSDLP